jgi:predicted small secreted protein
MKKTFPIITVLCLVAMALAGCGSNTPRDSSGSGETPASSESSITYQSTAGGVFVDKSTLGINDTWLVYCDFNTIIRSHLDGSDQKTIIQFDGNLGSFWATNDTIYYSVSIGSNGEYAGGQLWMSNFDAGSNKKLDDRGAMSILQFGDYVFYIRASTDGEKGSLWRMNLDGTEATELSPGINIGQGGYWVANNFVYITATNNEEYCVNVDGSNLKKINENKHVWERYKSDITNNKLVNGWTCDDSGTHLVFSRSGQRFDSGMTSLYSMWNLVAQ